MPNALCVIKQKVLKKSECEKGASSSVVNCSPARDDSTRYVDFLKTGLEPASTMHKRDWSLALPIITDWLQISSAATTQ